MEKEVHIHEATFRQQLLVLALEEPGKRSRTDYPFLVRSGALVSECFVAVIDSGILSACNAHVIAYVPGRPVRYPELLAPESHVRWNEAIRLLKDSPHALLAPLTYLGPANQLIPALAFMCRLSPGDQILVHSLFAEEKPRAALPDSHESRGMKELQAFILEHLDEPLPTLRQLARRLGTNEHSINDNFRKQFQTTVYRFYTEERLKRAMSLIRHSNIPLKNIALACGFSTYTSFSRAFRREYGKAPVSFKRWDAKS